MAALLADRKGGLDRVQGRQGAGCGGAHLDVLALFVRLQGNLHRNGALGGGLGVRVADVLNHAAHLVVQALFDGAVGHVNQAACFGMFHVVPPLALWVDVRVGLRPHLLSWV